MYSTYTVCMQPDNFFMPRVHQYASQGAAERLLNPERFPQHFAFGEEGQYKRCKRIKQRFKCVVPIGLVLRRLGARP